MFQRIGLGLALFLTPTASCLAVEDLTPENLGAAILPAPPGEAPQQLIRPGDLGGPPASMGGLKPGAPVELDPGYDGQSGVPTSTPNWFFSVLSGGRSQGAK